jgi:hypothetical protein
MVAWKMPTFFNVWRRTVVHSYSKKMLESGDKHILKKPAFASENRPEKRASLSGRGAPLSTAFRASITGVF